jgi:hypothetical protein
VGDIAPGHRPFAADIASLRHVLVLHKSRTERGGIDNTGGGELQEYGSGRDEEWMIFITGKWRFEVRERCQKFVPVFFEVLHENRAVL